MGKIQIVHYPNKKLRQQAKYVPIITSSHREKIARMFEIMYQLEGMGLAAPQVGWNARIFVMNHTGRPEDEQVFINPIIIEESGELREMEEGCLSFPGTTGAVTRKSKVLVKAQNLDGSYFKLEAEDWPGRCIQHEIDHLLGILLIDRATKLYKGKDPL